MAAIFGFHGLWSTRSSQKVSEIFWYRRFGAPWVRRALTECRWSFLRASYAEEAARQVASKDSGFCTTVTHRATHRLLCSNSFRHQRSYSPDLAPSGFWLFPTLPMDLKGTRFTTMEDITWNGTANSRNFQKKPSSGASNNGGIHGASVCVCVFVCVCACARARECVPSQGSNFEGN
jgi:hypothetical protein